MIKRLNSLVYVSIFLTSCANPPSVNRTDDARNPSVAPSTSGSNQKKKIDKAKETFHEKVRDYISKRMKGKSKNKIDSFVDHFFKVCEENEVDPHLVLAVIQVESAFKPKSKSHKGARGLMQLMPSTAQEVAKDIGLNYRGPADLYNPIVNTTLGIKYLSWLKERYPGKPQLYLAAYNAGPGFVDRVILKRTVRPGPIFQYVRSVLEKRNKLKEMIASKPEDQT